MLDIYNHQYDESKHTMIIVRNRFHINITICAIIIHCRSECFLHFLTLSNHYYQYYQYILHILLLKMYIYIYISIFTLWTMVSFPKLGNHTFLDHSKNHLQTKYMQVKMDHDLTQFPWGKQQIQEICLVSPIDIHHPGNPKHTGTI